MPDEVPTIMNHVSIAVRDFEKSLAFYDAVLAVIGGKRIVDESEAVAYGKRFPEFWVHSPPFDGGEVQTANGVHFAFFATSREQVQQFHKVALEHGATDDGAPGPRPEYGEPYYGAFVRDPDGHKLEATFWDG